MGTSDPVWTADFDTSPAVAAALIDTHFPSLRGGPLEVVGVGWDNTVYRTLDAAGDPWVIRLPRRHIALPTIEQEIALLPILADFVPLPIPTPELVGATDDDPSRPFWAGRMLPGVELAAAGLSADQRVDAAAALGEFLRVLHSPALLASLRAEHPQAAAVLRIDPNRRADAPSVVDRARGWLAKLAEEQLPAGLDSLLVEAAALPTPDAGAAVLSHGDLHLRHVLFAAGACSGVIDWGDACLSDRSADLSIAFAAFDGPSRAAFFACYGPIDATAEVRARAVAAFLCAALAASSSESGVPELHGEAIAGLGRAVGA